MPHSNDTTAPLQRDLPSAAGQTGKVTLAVPPKRQGLSRIWHALRHSWAGLAAVMQEAAFRQELLLSCLLIPAAWWVGQSWLETVVLMGACALVLLIEMLNTCVEITIDRIGTEWHPLSKRAKDIGSAAVLLSLLFCGGVWLSAIWRVIGTAFAFG